MRIIIRDRFKFLSFCGWLWIFIALASVVFLFSFYPAYAQSAIAYPFNFTTQWQTTTGFVPNSATSVTTQDSYVDYIHLANISNGTVTVTVTDASTNCSAGVCQWWPVISIPANTVYTQSLGGIFSPKGVKWTASSANAVVGWIKGKYPQ